MMTLTEAEQRYRAMREAAARANKVGEARTLIAQAESILSDAHGDPAMAIWRLVDAAGLVAETLHPRDSERLIGLADPTGRGYRLVGRQAMADRPSMDPLDVERVSSCGHKWTLRHTACPECFADLKREVGTLRDLLRWTRQTVHQAHHMSALSGCPKSVCRAIADALSPPGGAHAKGGV